MMKCDVAAPGASHESAPPGRRWGRTFERRAAGQSLVELAVLLPLLLFFGLACIQFALLFRAYDDMVNVTRDAARWVSVHAQNTDTTTADNVEIYVVGFYCVPYSTGGMGWCASKYADTTLTGSPHPCPGGVYPVAGKTPSTIDNFLQSISSSTAGTCDHYFPIGKNESLPQLFRVMAGSIARGHLQ